jgi:hypothetical protein
MRKRRKDEISGCERRVVMGDEANVRASEARPFAPTLVGRGECQLHLWMSRDDRAQLAAGVSACTEDSNRDSMHN